MAKIAFFELEEWEENLVKKAMSKHQLKLFSEPLSSSNVNEIKDIEIIAGFVWSKITLELLNKLPKLKLIATMSTGFDHIDLNECKNREIIVSNVPTYGENTVAEHTFALILALSRKVLQAVERTRRGNFSLDGLRGFDLKGKTIGVIGTGHIGLHVLRMAKGFEMNMLAFDIKKNTKEAKKLGFKYATLDNLLKNSDIVTLHAPYNEHTHHLINSNNIKKMKKGALLINTARGGLVETNALLKEIKSGKLGGAGLDVLEEEMLIKEEKQLLSAKLPANIKTLLENHILLNQENVIITPHSAFNSREALVRIVTTTLENINEYLKKKPTNVVS
ncbi:hydroxyacid dehydrogenase [Candidatus Woesearchaeota archaeon]|nr:hydroxyacid dehydrogenase [Candidatus Woesearchaeota archaeon]|tara:strand:- start:17238 stop:18236 length:999 start_codon:yes stop_codon:yes gene_type:complete